MRDIFIMAFGRYYVKKKNAAGHIRFVLTVTARDGILRLVHV